jgi:hypothetical protein
LWVGLWEVFGRKHAGNATRYSGVSNTVPAAVSVLGRDQARFTETDHTVYSLRHTAICMRIIMSEGRVNIFNLAKNAGTSVEQIERFYAKHLPMSKEMAKNLHLFGREQ